MRISREGVTDTEMADIKDRMAEQHAEEREHVAKQTGSGAPDVSTRIEDSGAAAPRVAEETARAADKKVRGEIVEDIKDAITQRGGQG